jgi:hypothetical protein
MNTITKSQAERLATDYNAFNKAYDADDHEGVVCWGEMLLSTQRELGIVMYTEELLESILWSARRAVKTKRYVVKQAVDTMDTNPKVSAPLEQWEAEELASEWIQEAVDWSVEHWCYTLSEEELEEIRENETALVTIEEVA